MIASADRPASGPNGPRGRRLVFAAAALGAAAMIAACGSSGSSSSAAASASASSSAASSGAASTAAASSASPSASFHLVHPGTLTVAVNATPPDFVISPSGSVSGIVMSILHTFAAAHHLKVATQIYSFSGALTAVESGRADVTGAFYYTPTRAKAVRYARPYAVDGSYIAVQRSTPYTGPASMKGKSVGVAAGYAQVPYLQQYLGDSHVVQFASDPSGIEALKTGRVAGYVSANDLLYYARQDPSLKVIQLTAGTFDQPASVTDQTDNIFASCHNQALADAISATIEQMWKSGALKALLAKYGEAATFPPNETQPNLCGQ
ncbi:MAG TPA: ABC transporter substrate-binding protein [Solirubrobacteraceae bacterium]|nr:ABC transporter substrate-binding protein [Solirubrobacteraceae bacterium]